MFRKSLGRRNCGINKTFFRLKYEWVEPTGHDTKIKIYNEFVQDKVPLIFPNKNFVKWYMCGPTVYDTSHIGHGCCYVKLDIIHRILKEHFDIHPVVAIGVTDVAEDIFKRAKQTNRSVQEITHKYSNEFFQQMNALNVLPPTFKLRVSTHMNVIHNFVDFLIRRRAAYKGVDGTIYFNTEADPNYGRFREPPPPDGSLKPGRRDHRDFALWKVSDEYKIASPWGKGFPGWHIECSAMASHVFGNSIDIHSGGTDLIFPHHENEEAQSTCYHKCNQWVNYWLHAGLVNVRNEKMSKSLGNFIPIKEFLTDHTSDHLRMFCFMSSYRSELNYDETTMQLVISTCEKIVNFLDLAESYVAGTWVSGDIQESQLLEELEKTKKEVKTHLVNDFGTAGALTAVTTLIKTATKMLTQTPTKASSRSPAAVSAVRDYVGQFFRSAGFTLSDSIAKVDGHSAIDAVISTAVNVRAQVREIGLALQKPKWKQNVLSLCDTFRQKLLDLGVVIHDMGPSQSQWLLKSSHVESKTLLKDVIDCVVWFRKEIREVQSSITYSESPELTDISRYIQMYFGTLGVTIKDEANGRVEWTFPNLEKGGSHILEEVVHSTLQFHSKIEEAARSLPDVKTRDDLLCICETVISDLEELGVNVDEKHKTFEIDEEKGTSVLHQTIEIIVHSRDQMIAIAEFTTDNHLRQYLFKESSRLRKLLMSFGFTIVETSSNILTSWNMRRDSVNNMVLVNLVDAAVKFLNLLVRHSRKTTDDVARRIILELYNSVTADLRSIGVVGKHIGEENSTWIFKPSELPGGYTVEITPESSVDDSDPSIGERQRQQNE